MGKYLKLFETHSQYEAYVVGGEYLRPNVSHCISEDDVHYTLPIYWPREYFTIESLEDNNTIYLKATSTSIAKTVSASTDNGETWQEYTSIITGSGTTLATLNNGDKLLIKGQNRTYGTSSYYNQFKSTGQFEVKGNIMSLISGGSFINADELTTSYTFNRLFSGCSGLTSAENLVLPATTLANSCYRYMFGGCTSLTTAPELPATTLANNCYGSMFSNCASLTTAPELPATTLVYGCYNGMFKNCASLNYIKAMFTTAPGGSYTYAWVTGVASTGTFVKNASATWTTTGSNGVPAGWTVQTASA